MNEKRKYIRYKCRIECSCRYFAGDPDKVDPDKDTPIKGRGLILDISRGGIFIVSDDSPAVNMPVKISFAVKNKTINVSGRIVRTGMLESNPSDIAVLHSAFSIHGKNYIAVEFNSPIENISETDFV